MGMGKEKERDGKGKGEREGDRRGEREGEGRLASHTILGPAVPLVFFATQREIYYDIATYSVYNVSSFPIFCNKLLT